MRFARNTSGASAVEFALVLPIFAMLLFGIISYGAYLSVVHSIQQLAAEAARASIAGISDSERADIARRKVFNQATSYPFIDPERLFVELAATDLLTSTFKVRLRYDADDMFVFQLPTILPMPSRQVIRTAAVQRGGF